MLRLTRYLTKNYDTPDGHKLSVYEKGGGYQQAKRALGMTREALVEEMKAANIRGRGGAGFAMGVKWSFMPWPPKPERPPRGRSPARRFRLGCFLLAPPHPGDPPGSLHGVRLDGGEPRRQPLGSWPVLLPHRRRRQNR